MPTSCPAATMARHWAPPPILAPASLRSRATGPLDTARPPIRRQPARRTGRSGAGQGPLSGGGIMGWLNSRPALRSNTPFAKFCCTRIVKAEYYDDIGGATSRAPLIVGHLARRHSIHTGLSRGGYPGLARCALFGQSVSEHVNSAVRPLLARTTRWRGQMVCIDAPTRGCSRVEDCIPVGEDTRVRLNTLGRPPR